MARTTDEITPEQITKKQPGTAKVAAEYFDAISRHDVEAAVAMWKPGGREFVRGQVDTTAPDGVRAFIGGLIASIPDLRFEVVETTVQQDRAAVRWRLRGTFAGEPYMGIEATGTPLELEGVDVLIVRDGQIVENNAFSDGMTFAQQVGLLPPAESKAQQRVTSAFNAKTRLGKRMAGAPEEIADGVWLVRGGFPGKTMNVYLLRDGDGVTVFDGGVRAMVNQVAGAGAALGGITKLVLSHAHPDHRGIAPRLGVPVHCHPADKADAEGDGGAHYFDFSQLDLHGRLLMPRFLKSWDGGPVEIAGTVEEGDDVAGFKVVHLPGHAPGMIGLWRESDRLALAGDCFYTLDPQTGRKGRPRVPHHAFNADTEHARASIRKLAALEPAVAWPGHADALRGDVRSQLEQAAATT